MGGFRDRYRAVSLAASALTVKAGSVVVLTGRTAPLATWTATAVAQRLVRGSWRGVVKAALSSRGHYRLVAPVLRGAQTLRVVVRSPAHAPTPSRTVVIHGT